MPKKFQGFLNPEEAYSEHSYLLMIRKGSRFSEIDKEFLSLYENFVREDARDILITELETHIEQLKNISWNFLIVVEKWTEAACTWIIARAGN